MGDLVEILLRDLNHINQFVLPTEAADVLCNERILSLTEDELDAVFDHYDERLVLARAVDTARKCLLGKNNAVVPAVAAKLRKEGFSVVTFKCSETTGNIAVMIGTKNGFIEVADDFHWTKLLHKAISWPADTEQQPKPKSFWSRLFG